MGSLAAMAWPGSLPDWSNLDVLHRNTLPARAHFYNYPSEDAALSMDREQSLFHSLNGTWKFHYDESPYTAPLWETANTSAWDDIEVPGMWQLQGYGRPQYVNINYPFPVTPPNVSYVNPTGSYWREFEVPEDWEDQQIRLRFEGVDSAFHVWVNGEEVGYSQGARNPSEWDITDYLSEDGKNSLAARVYQWSDGSYLEDQDQWWLSGIFRDVSLIAFAESAIVDYSVVPEVSDDFKSGRVTANVTVQGDHGDMTVKLISPMGDVLDKWSGSSSDKYSAKVARADFKVWSAETPDLYTLLISFNGRTITQKVGFRRVEMSGANFLVNGEPIILHGVNRHEHNHLRGRTIAYEDMRADLIRMKRSNINAIRTSHQPPHPSFFDVANELGFYVIAEADLECHGFGNFEDAASWTSDNPEWEQAYLDRAEQLVEHHKNNPAIIIWSLGNECFYGQNHAAMADWIRKKDPTRVIHYEPDSEAVSVDMYSQMYKSPDDIRKHLEEHTDKPYILCEFAHAMGNGPGGLLEYIELMRSEPRFQGGLVWEWNNHGLLKKEGDLEYYAYGGDFGDEPNDADFVMDGLTLSDHTPMPSLGEYAKVIQPVSVKLAKDPSKMTVTNHYAFVGLNRLGARWHVVQDGKKTTKSKHLKMPRIAAGQTRTVDLPIDPTSFSEEAWVVVEFTLKEDTNWAEKGHVVAWDQLHLPGSSSNEKRLAQSISPRKDGSLEIVRDRTMLEVKNGESTYGFDMLNGNVTWNAKGVDLLQRGPELYFYRALTQNDAGGGGDGQDWSAAWLGSMRTQVRQVTWGDSSDSEIAVTYKVWVAPQVLDWGVDATLTYTITAGDMSLRVDVKGDFSGETLPSVVPRIGLLSVVPKSFDQVSYFGRGPGENYKDSKQACRMGEYESTVDGLWQEYDYPQENGNREDLRWLKMSDGSLTLDARRVDGKNEPFSFTARRYMPHDLDDAKHPYDLKPLNMTVLNLDYDNHGLGSASVGPRPFKQYECKTEPFEFSFALSVE